MRNTSHVIRRFAKLLVVLALSGLIGLHWVFLQTVAWAGMVISYSHDAPFVEAVSKTFDGQHPCKLCIQIAKGQRSEKKAQVSVKVSKLEFRYSAVVFIFQSPSGFWEMSSPDEFSKALDYPPPSPPPKTLPV